MGTKYVNDDGLVQHYGTRVAENVIPGAYDTDGAVKEMVVAFDFNSVNASAAGTVLGVTTADLALRTEIPTLPLGAHIVGTYLNITEVFSATIEVDIVTAAKVADAGSHANGIASAASAVGILAGNTPVTPALAQASYIDAFETAGAGTGALTTGAAEVTVQYIVR